MYLVKQKQSEMRQFVHCEQTQARQDGGYLGGLTQGEFARNILESDIAQQFKRKVAKCEENDYRRQGNNESITQYLREAL